MVTAVLIFLIGASCVLHFNQNKLSILIFAAICGFFQFFHNAIYYLTGFEYYLGAAFIDLSIISILSTISKPTKMVCMLQKACLCLIYMNLFGWIIYELYISPEFYNSLCIALFIAVLLISIITRKKDGLGDSEIFSNRSLVFSGNYSRSFKMRKNKGAQRS